MKAINLFLAALAALASSTFAVDLGTSANGTPYDSYMYTVKQVLSSVHGGDPSMEKVQALLRQGRGFRYSFTTPYVAATPEVTAKTRSGDCKAKALWLIDQLGDSDARFVVGKAHYGHKLSHAWVLWKNAEGKWFILDPTLDYKPIAADSVRRDDYIPLYSWSKNGTYRHAATQIGLAAVAGKRSAVAVNDRG